MARACRCSNLISVRLASPRPNLLSAARREADWARFLVCSSNWLCITFVRIAWLLLILCFFLLCAQALENLTDSGDADSSASDKPVTERLLFQENRYLLKE